nr:transmembrane emp24 domain-containing protein 11-like isoform X2 [Paramormyrops kingsleyae]
MCFFRVFFTRVLGHYEERQLPSSWTNCYRERPKSSGTMVLMSKRYGSQGKFTFTSHSSGQHFLCLKSNSTRFSIFAGDRLRLHLDVQMGEHTIDPGAARAKDTVKNMEYVLRHLIDQVLYIGKQQDFQREREEMFRQMSEDTNGKVLWWAVVQTAILLTVGFWQVKRLKDFLIEKKLV